jgi:putative nucleotidyltransferase with HDIG domain
MIMEASIAREKRLRQIETYISQMPSLSTTVTKVLEICNSPTTSPNDLNRVISLDPVLTGKVMKLINSAYYSLPNEVTTLTRGILMLGLNTVKNLALSTSVLESLRGNESVQALSMDDFWTHSLCVGVIAKHLAAIKDVPAIEREEYFVAGLLHDLGKIVLSNRFPEDYVQALDSARLDHGCLHQAESAVLGVDHCVVGKMIARKWQLGDTMNDSMCHHHDPDEAGEANRQFVTMVALANTYANVFEIGSSGDSSPENTIVDLLLQQVGVRESTISDLRETVLNEIENAKVFLQIANRS